MAVLDSEFKALQQELGHLRKDLVRVADSVRDVQGEALGRLRAGTEKFAGERLREARRFAHDLEDQVEEHPLATAFTGLALGVVLGLMLASRRK